MSWQYFKQTYPLSSGHQYRPSSRRGSFPPTISALPAPSGRDRRIHPLGGQLLQLAGVHTEEWGYFKLIHLDGTPLTRIDGMMIIGMFGAVLPPRCGLTTLSCECLKAGYALCRRLSAA